MYAVLSDLNAVAVLGVSGNNLSIQGYIPVGWYPTGVVVSPDGNRLLVTNAKGITPRIPSTGYQLFEFNDNPWYDLNSLLGTVAIVPMPDQGLLAELTNQVLQNNKIVTTNWSVNNEHRLDPISLQAGKIKHVIYIVKENRTYDQVLGDLPQGQRRSRPGAFWR